MASGSFNITRTGGSQYLSFPVIWSATPNTPGNYSDVVVSVYVDKSSASTSNTWGTSNTSVSLDGQNQVENGLGFTVVPGGRTLIFAKAYRVNHDSDGKKKITISVDVGGDVMWASGSSEVTLDTIPRASSIAVGNYNLGQNVSVTIGKKNNGFTSTLTYKIGSRTGTIATKTSNSTYVWEMSDELISQIKADNPSNKNISAIIYCETYSGDTKIGDTQSATFTLVIIDKPIISDVVINETIKKIKKYTTSLVKYLSVPQFNITAIASEGTSISVYRVKVGDREITSSSDGLTVNNIQYSYLVDDVRKTNFIITVTDARGNMSEEYNVEMDFIEYVQLAFNNTDIKLIRENNVSNIIKLHLTGYIFNGVLGETQNTFLLQYRYKLKNDNTAIWSELKEVNVTLNDDNTFVIDNLQIEDEFDYRENYDIEFYGEDLFQKIEYKEVIKTSESLYLLHKNGLDLKGLTINKKSVFGVEKSSYSRLYSDGFFEYFRIIKIGTISAGNVVSTNFSLGLLNEDDYSAHLTLLNASTGWDNIRFRIRRLDDSEEKSQFQINVKNTSSSDVSDINVCLFMCGYLKI